MSALAFLKRLAPRVLPRPVIQPLYRLWSMKLVDGPLTYNADGLATRHNADFMREPRFAQAYERAAEAGVWQNANIQWRVYVACWAAAKGRSLEGDFVECGVYRGSVSRAVMHYIGFRELPDRRFYLVDTYEGMIESLISDEEKKHGRRGGVYEPTYDAVKRTFSDTPNAIVVKGVVPEILTEVRPEKVAYLSLDMNCAGPEVAAAEHFWPRMVSGAAIVLDDYGWTGHIEQKRALDAWAASKGVDVLSLPTGQGLIFKP